MAEENLQSGKKKKLEDLLFNLVVVRVKKNGNRVRHLTRVIASAYEDNPDELKKYFEDSNGFVAGIATSAYHFLTGDIKPIQKIEDGGLGAIISQSENGLKFSKWQLRFAKLTGTALQYSRNRGSALMYSENSGDALKGSRNKGYTLMYSKNSGNALRDSGNKRYALEDSENSEDALEGSKNSGYSLNTLKNSGNAVKYAENRDALSRQREYVRVNLKNEQDALRRSEKSIWSRLSDSLLEWMDEHIEDTRYAGTSEIFFSDPLPDSKSRKGVKI